jgi:hypothetical protein
MALQIGRKRSEVVQVEAAKVQTAAEVLSTTSQKGDTVRLTVQVRRELHRRLRLAALLRGETLAGMVSGWAESLPAS